MLFRSKIFWLAESPEISINSEMAVAISVITLLASIAMGAIFHRLVELPVTRQAHNKNIDHPSLRPAVGRVMGSYR